MLGLVSLGYMFTKKDKNPTTAGQPRVAPSPANRELGDRDMAMHRRLNPDMNTAMVRSAEMRKAQELERAPNFVSQQAGVNPFKDPGGRGGGRGLSEGYYSELAGVSMTADDFRHNNMMPFFGGSLRGMSVEQDNGALMENFSGAAGPGNSMRRTEQAPMFRPEDSAAWTTGAPAFTEQAGVFDRYRSSVGATRNNERPFEPTNVGPGLDQGYSARGSGGFAQNDTRDHIMPKSVDELRTADNPKRVMEGRVVPGAGMPQRGLIGEVRRDRPETAFDDDRGMIGTRGMDRAAGELLSPVVYAIERKKEPLGGGGFGGGPETGAFAAGSAGGGRGMPFAPRFQPFEQKLPDSGGMLIGATAVHFAPGMAVDAPRPGATVEAFEQPGPAADASLDLWRNMLGPAGSLTPGAHLSASQAMRPSGKETTEDAGAGSYAFGNMSVRIPSKPPAYDPGNMIARTTLKETGIHDSRSGNFGAGVPHAATDIKPQDLARHTVREFFDDYPHTVRNPRTLTQEGAENRGRAMQPPGATMRDALQGFAPRDGSAVMPGKVPGSYATNDMRVEHTNREFTGQRSYVGAAASRGGEPTGYAAQLDAMRGGEARGGGTTLEGFTAAAGNQTSGMSASGLRGAADFDYYGIPKSDESKGIDYAQLYSATFNEAKESMLRSRVPGGRAGPAEAAAVQSAGTSQLRPEPAQPAPGAAVRTGRALAPAGMAHVAPDTGGSRLRHDSAAMAGADRLDTATLSWVDGNPFVNTGTWNAGPKA